jgi:hypothetical protein
VDEGVGGYEPVCASGQRAVEYSHKVFGGAEPALHVAPHASNLDNCCC